MLCQADASSADTSTPICLAACNAHTHVTKWAPHNLVRGILKTLLSHLQGVFQVVETTPLFSIKACEMHTCDSVRGGIEQLDEDTCASSFQQCFLQHGVACHQAGKRLGRSSGRLGIVALCHDQQLAEPTHGTYPDLQRPPQHPHMALHAADSILAASCFKLAALVLRTSRTHTDEPQSGSK